MWQLFIDTAWKIVLAGVVLGAGLPALFAVGVRAQVAVTPDGTSAPPARRAAGMLCFAVVLAAVALGITIIVATGFGKVVSFEHIYPTLAPKS